jgi:hypothetical protein
MISRYRGRIVAGIVIAGFTAAVGSGGAQVTTQVSTCPDLRACGWFGPS